MTLPPYPQSWNATPGTPWWVPAGDSKVLNLYKTKYGHLVTSCHSLSFITSPAGNHSAFQCLSPGGGGGGGRAEGSLGGGTLSGGRWVAGARDLWVQESDGSGCANGSAVDGVEGLPA